MEEEYSEKLLGIEIRKVDNGYVIHVSKTEPEENYIADTIGKVGTLVEGILLKFEKKCE